MYSIKKFNLIIPIMLIVILLFIVFLIYFYKDNNFDTQPFVYLLLIILGLLLLFYFYRNIRRDKSISSLIKMTEGISTLDFNALEIIEDQNEIYKLSKNLKKMADSLEYRFNSAIRQRKELKAVFSSLIESIIVIDDTFKVRDINRAALTLFKNTNNLVKGKSLIELTRNSELIQIAEKTLFEKLPQYKTILFKEQIPYSVDKFKNHKFTSRDIYLEVNTSLIQTEDHATRIIMVLHDITQLKTLERIRKDFVANVSHELKTPITSILGFVETLKDGAINNKETSMEFLDIIQTQTVRLDLIIKDLLSLSTLESYENTDIELEEIYLADIISASIKGCNNLINNKKTDIRVNLPDKVKIKANSRLLEQALVNLICNAAKYCPIGSVIDVKVEKYSDYTLIKVSDNGPGIPATDAPRVFERFYTVNKARNRNLGGTGLGLAIVKHIILAHKGEIRLKVPNDKGTEFIIRIPN